MSDLDPLFAPRRVAVLGASRNPTKLGHVLLRNVLAGGFTGEVLVVNPSGEPVLGCPTVRTTEELPEGVDLALVSLPPAAVLPSLSALAGRRARTAVILTSGFGEVDEQGRSAQAALLGAARGGGLRLVGPNCMGVYSRPAGLNGTYFWDVPALPGGLSIVSQSGAYGGLIMRHAGTLGLGVCRFLSVGNQVDLDIAAALEYLADDAETTLVACFVESVRDGRRFVEAALRVSRSKPVVVLKGGRSEAGGRAAGSHTGSLAGATEAYQAAFRRAGVVACADTEEFFDAIQALASPQPRPQRASLAIVTVSGGPSVIAADTAEACGLEVPALTPGRQGDLRGILPPFAAVGNPVDLTPQVDPGAIAAAASLALAEPAVGGALAVNIGLDVPAFADGLVEASGRLGKPLLACAVDAPTVIARLRAAGVPVYATPERAVRAYRTLWRGRARVAERAAEPAVPPPSITCLPPGPGPLRHVVARALLESYGLRFCRERLVSTADDAGAAATDTGYPVVVKTAREGLLHRTELGAVRTDLGDAHAVARAWREVAARTGSPEVLVQEQLRGLELLVGGRRDETFGPMVALGTGGFWAEALRDVSVALAPVGLEEARGLVPEGLRGRLMGGYRGLPAWQGEPVARALVGLGRAMTDHPEIQEIDVNPLIVSGGAATAVDVVVIVG
jgi:acetyltransferase